MINQSDGMKEFYLKKVPIHAIKMDTQLSF